MAGDIEPQRLEIRTPEELAAWTGDIDAWNVWGAEHDGKDFEPLDHDRPVHLVLSDEAAMELWRQGKGAWNGWVAKNPRADIFFVECHFEARTRVWSRTPLIDFGNFVFPHGDVCFDYATFGEGDVSFDRATFGEGNVSFNRAKFNKGDVSFYCVTFGEGDVGFFETTFGKGTVSFNLATFGEGDVSFYRATFGEGDLKFKNAALNKGDVDFNDASFGRGAVWLHNLTFEGTARFDGLRDLEHCTQFSFEGCSFDKLFTFSHKGRMGCPLDLRRTKLTHGVVLNDVKCDYVEVPVLAWPARLSHWFFAYPDGEPPAWKLLKRAADPQDSQRFRRLKELALSENNRAKALEFNAQELRSQRGHESHPLQDFLQFFYMLLSDYGRSVVRPLVALGVVTGLFGAIYAQLSTNPKTPSFMDALPAALTYSGGNMFAFVPIGRSALEQSRADLFGDKVPYELLWIAGSQSVLSVILLFLLGLGLRNMFRL